MKNVLDIIIPVYNEKENILNTLKEIKKKITIKCNILIIYDFDEDNTLPVVKRYSKLEKNQKITLIKNFYGSGILNAIKTGLESAKYKAVLVVMGDASDDLIAVNAMYELINKGYDIVCGSRYMKGGKQIGGPVFKSLLSRFAGISLYYLTGIPTHDITNSFKMYRTEIFKNISIESLGGFEIGMEIVVKCYIKGYKITEVPSIWRDRDKGISKFKLFQWIPRYIKWYIFLILKRKNIK